MGVLNSQEGHPVPWQVIHSSVTLPSRYKSLRKVRVPRKSPKESWSVSPPRVLPLVNFLHARFPQKHNTRGLVNFSQPSWPIGYVCQVHFWKFVPFLEYKFHRFDFTGLDEDQKSSFETLKVRESTCIGRFGNALYFVWGQNHFPRRRYGSTLIA